MILRWLFPLLLGALQGLAVVGSRAFSEGTVGRQWSYILLGVVTLAQAFLAAWNAERAHRARLETDAQASLYAALTKLTDKIGMKPAKVALHAFVVRRRWRRLWTPLHVQVARIKPGDSRPPSTIVWTRGKGVIGECWRQKHEVVFVAFYDTRFRDLLSCNKTRWYSIAEGDRMGFTFEEWSSIRDRYRGIVAAPMVSRAGDGFKYSGCVTLDALDQQTFDTILAADNKELASGVLSDAAQAILVTIRGRT